MINLPFNNSGDRIIIQNSHFLSNSPENIDDNNYLIYSIGNN
jgi:hypothetical protein